MHRQLYPHHHVPLIPPSARRRSALRMHHPCQTCVHLFDDCGQSGGAGKMGAAPPMPFALVIWRPILWGVGVTRGAELGSGYVFPDVHTSIPFVTTTHIHKAHRIVNSVSSHHRGSRSTFAVVFCPREPRFVRRTVWYRPTSKGVTSDLSPSSGRATSCTMRDILVGGWAQGVNGVKDI